MLGRVLRPHGLRGELRVNVLTDYPERIVAGSKIYMGSDPDNAAKATLYEVVKSRPHLKYLILQFDEIPDRTAAERFRGQYIMVPLEDAIPLEEGEFYLFQAIGLAVYTDEGEHLGQVSEIIETGANDVYVVHGPRGEVLLPAIEECVLDVDIEAKKITVHVMDGLLPD